MPSESKAKRKTLPVATQFDSRLTV